MRFSSSNEDGCHTLPGRGSLESGGMRDELQRTDHSRQQTDVEKVEHKYLGFNLVSAALGEAPGRLELEGGFSPA